MSDVAELIDRGVREKGASRDETKCIVDALPTLEGNTLRRAILVIGYSSDRSYRQVIEPYLYYTAKSSVVVEALNVLTQKFELAPDYIRYVQQGLKGYDWDEFGNVQDECLTAAAYILRTEPQHKNLAKYIYNRLVAVTDAEPDVYAADAAQIALGATSRERAVALFDSPANLSEHFKQRFLITELH